MSQDQQQQKKHGVILTRGHSLTSTPSPPLQNIRSPASGYSKSILSAIKDLPYDHNSRGTSRATSTNSSAIQSPNNNETLTDAKEGGQTLLPVVELANENGGGITRTTTILRIKVGNVDNHDKEREATRVQRQEENERSSSSRRRERRSTSCETGLLENSAADTAANTTPNVSVLKQLQVQQRTQSVNMLNDAEMASPFSASSSCFSLRSVASTAGNRQIQGVEDKGARLRSPSVASSICSKEADEKSTASNLPPKIRISVCAKALYACANGQLQELRLLVKETPDLINYQYPYCYRQSCLHIAAQAGDLDIVNYLVRNGAILDAKDTWSTPLHLAAKAGNLDMVAQLIQMDIDQTARDAYGRLASDYLSDNARLQLRQNRNVNKKSATLRAASKTREAEEGFSNLLSTSTQGSQCSLNSLNSSTNPRHHYSFQSFRKPITRAVRDLLHMK